MIFRKHSEEAGSCNSDKESRQGYEVASDLQPVVREGADAQQDDVTRHRVGKDVAVVQIDERVEQTAGRRKQAGSNERIGLKYGLRLGQGRLYR